MLAIPKSGVLITKGILAKRRKSAIIRSIFKSDTFHAYNRIARSLRFGKLKSDRRKFLVARTKAMVALKQITDITKYGH